MKSSVGVFRAARITVAVTLLCVAVTFCGVTGWRIHLQHEAGNPNAQAERFLKAAGAGDWATANLEVAAESRAALETAGRARPDVWGTTALLRSFNNHYAMHFGTDGYGWFDTARLVRTSQSSR